MELEVIRLSPPLDWPPIAKVSQTSGGNAWLNVLTSVLDAFLNLIFGTDFQVTDDEAVQQGRIYEATVSLKTGPCAGVWLCGAKNDNAMIVNVEDRCSEMTVSINTHLKWV